jgi:hypothetical protein
LAFLLILSNSEDLMRRRARQLILVVLLVVVAAIARAQVVWQPTAPPLVTAENEAWYLRGEPIIWSGDYFYPAGAQVFFNGNQMVRSGSFRGIPLYTDATRDALGIVFVPLPGGLMQPYERRRTGQLAGTTGNTAPSFPTDIGVQGMMGTEGIAVDLAQTPGPPDFARPYDVAPVGERARPVGSGQAVLTRSERVAVGPVSSEAIAAGGQSIVYAPRGKPQATSPRRKALNGMWVEFDGQRWFADGTAEVFDSGQFSERGVYHGFTVYSRRGERGAIYIPSVPGLVTPYKLRK